MANWKEPKNDYKKEDQVVPEIFNTLAENERYLQEKKITTEQVQDAEVNSTQSATRENVGDKETVKGFFGKVRKWFADLRALAFKGTVGTADIDSSAVTSAKIASNAVTSAKIASNAVTTAKINAKAVTDEKINSVSASKVTGLHKVATSGSYNDLTDKPTIPSGGGGSDFGATFVVDSDEKLALWVNNDKSNDYSVVLIKKGTWSSSATVSFKTYNGRNAKKCGVNLSQTKTKIIIGEAGSKLYFSVADNSTFEVWGLAYEYGDLRSEKDGGYFISGVTVQSHGSKGFTDTSTDCFSCCVNLFNCVAISENGYEGSAFSSCHNLYNCRAEITCVNNARAFSGCHNVFNCFGHSMVTEASRKWIGGSSMGFYSCENVMGCYGSATCTPATTDYTAYGFSGCKGVYRCKQNKKSSTDTFKNSYYSNSNDATYACANTLNGGFNDLTNS